MNDNKILMKKYKQYLLPSILTSLALALNEFVDCMLVSNLLGSDALAIANIGCPVILLIAACYVLLGNGGSILYAICLGRWDKETAGKVFRLSLILSAVGGVLFFAIGMLFKGTFTEILCADKELLPTFQSYYHVLLYSAPVLMLTLTFVSFLPPSGAPVIATIVMLVLMKVRKVRPVSVPLTRRSSAKRKGGVLWLIGRIVAQGAPAAMLQVCFAIKYGFSNGLAVNYGGRDGVVAFSLCLQTFSIASVFLLGVADTAQPLLAMLYGQKDYKGERTVLKHSFFLQIIFALGLIAFFEILPQAIAGMYGVNDPEVLRLGKTGIRLFALTYLPRGIGIQFMRFFQVEQRRIYAFFISLMDGLLVLPVGYFLCELAGLNGVFISYPISAALMLLVIVIINARIYMKRPKDYCGISLVRKDSGSIANKSFTITDASEDISNASEQMIDLCSEQGVPRKLAFRVGLLIEEMAVYTRQHRTDEGDIDITLRLTEREITINFRSIGTPFDPTTGKEGDIPENILMLKSMASRISYDYIMGMNSTLILIERS